MASSLAFLDGSFADFLVGCGLAPKTVDIYTRRTLARWITHSTGWSRSASIGWARTVIVVVAVIVAVFAYWLIQPQNLLP